MNTVQPSIFEPGQKVPVVANPDVLVLGGGPAGVAAALAASRFGLETLLVERYNHLGGLWTGGLVLPLLSTHGIDATGAYRKVIFGIADEIICRLSKINGVIRDVNPVIDPEAGKYMLDLMTKESKVRVLYHCWVSSLIYEDNRIQAVIMLSKAGKIAIQPRMVIDATGDGDVLAMAGESFTNHPYNLGLIHRLGNTDRVDDTTPGFIHHVLGSPTPVPGVTWVNMMGDDGQDALDPDTLSGLTQSYRIQIWEHFLKLRESPGYEKVFLADTASQLGVRVSRVLHGKYVMTLEDSMTYRKFDDVIGCCGGWRETHYGVNIFPKDKRPVWQIPLSAIIPKKTYNLLVAGRCFSYAADLIEDARIIGAAMITGHAAGVAATVALTIGSSVQSLPYKDVQRLLLSQNAYLG
jgi:hypothetical protein